MAQGGLPIRYPSESDPGSLSPPKEVREFDGIEYVLERGIICDFGLVHAQYGDRHGNLVYAKSAQNFNPLCAAAARVTIAEVEELVDPGEIDPGSVHTPGIFVQRVVAAAPEKRIEKRTVSNDSTGSKESAAQEGDR